MSKLNIGRPKIDNKIIIPITEFTFPDLLEININICSKCKLNYFLTDQVKKKNIVKVSKIPNRFNNGKKLPVYKKIN